MHVPKHCILNRLGYRFLELLFIVCLLKKRFKSFLNTRTKVILVTSVLVCFPAFPSTGYVTDPPHRLSFSVKVVPADSLDTNISRIVPDRLQKVVKAIIRVESKGNSKAYRKAGNCAGILQITPIYVTEVNRILEEERYSLEDRYDTIKSLEMFTIYQNSKNPKHNIHKAIKLHNHGKAYHKKVMAALAK